MLVGSILSIKGSSIEVTLVGDVLAFIVALVGTGRSPETVLVTTEMFLDTPLVGISVFSEVVRVIACGLMLQP